MMSSIYSVINAGWKRDIYDNISKSWELTGPSLKIWESVVSKISRAKTGFLKSKSFISSQQ